MIVRPRPRSIELLFILRGSIIPRIAGQLLVIVGFSCLVLWLVRTQAPNPVVIPLAPFSFLGLALSVFLGFRNNACYDRWWEARRQWGDLIVQARSFARETGALLGPSLPRAAMVRHVIAFAHALCARLRDTDELAAASPWLPSDRRASLGGRRNIPEGLLRGLNDDLASCLRRGELSDILYEGLNARVLAMGGIQAACERIRSTPPPFAYSLLLHRTAWLFCLLLPFGLAGAIGLMSPVVVAITAYTFFGLDALGDELEEPFGLTDNDLPLNALVRTIEIDLLESLGETNLPPPLLPENYLLQ
ncbi:MAG TPA: bestrophin family protein [Moraxellaceae bacterium]|nr:bestrophin family protein [Moraxellaceae bacterium]